MVGEDGRGQAGSGTPASDVVEEGCDVERPTRVQEHQTVTGLDRGGAGQAQIDEDAGPDLFGHEPRCLHRVVGTADVDVAGPKPFGQPADRSVAVRSTHLSAHATTLGHLGPPDPVMGSLLVPDAWKSTKASGSLGGSGKGRAHAR